MHDRIRRALSYSNVMSTIAVFAVLGGGAYAATKIGPEDIRKNAVRAKHVKKGQIAAKHLKRNAVSRVKIRAGAVNEGKLAANSVTGAKVDEATLGIVPNADRLDGLDSTSLLRGAGRLHGGVLFDPEGGTSTSLALDIGGTLALACNSPASAPSTLTFTNTSGTTADVWTEKMQGAALPSSLTVAHSSVADDGTASLSVSGPVVASGESLLRFTIAVGTRATTIDAKLIAVVDGCRAVTTIAELR